MTGLYLGAQVDSSKRHELVQMLQTTAARSVAGRSLAQVFERVGEPSELLWVEHWEDTGLLEAYRESDPFRALVGAVKVLGTLQEIRVARFDPANGLHNG